MNGQDPERVVLNHALQQGYITTEQARELEAQGGPLLHALARRVAPEHLAVLRSVFEASIGGSALPDKATRIRGPGAPSVPPGFGERAIPKTIGGYTLERELARGGMGAVFVARQPGLERQVALKIMLGTEARRIKRFQTEARATARLRHPNIVAIHEVGEDQGFQFLTMDLIDGESLQARIERDGPLEPRLAAELLEQVARGVYEAHCESILHRDLKPANVLIDGSGRALVTDFGLAKLTDADTQSLTKTGAHVGSPAYMAPEQARGAKDQIDRRTDVWGLGATLYEALTGTVPFRGENAVRLLYQIVNEPPERPSKRRRQIPRDLEAICLRCLEKAHEDRYPSVRDLADDLRRFLDGEPIGGGRTRTSRRPTSNRLTLGLGLALVLALLAAGLAYRGQDRVRQASQAELEGLLRFEQARTSGWAGADADAARESLGRASASGEATARTWTALARLALEAGDAEGARRFLDRARNAGAAGGEADYVSGCLRAEAGELDAALQAFAASRSAGFTGRSLDLREAQAQAVAHEQRGWHASAEAARFRALRLGAHPEALLREIVRARLASDDVEGLSLLWAELHHRLGEEGQPGLQQVRMADGPALVRALAKPDAEGRLRLRAALSGALFAQAEFVDALRSAANANRSPVLREAARASLLRLGRLERVGGSKPFDRTAEFEAWARDAAQATELDGACQALTLLEHADWMTNADRPALEFLCGARGTLLRAALPLALAYSATRAGGLSLEAAQALLEGLEAEGAPLVEQRRVRVGEALGVLQGEDATPSPAGLELARRLWEAPGLAASVRAVEGYPQALEVAAKGGQARAVHLGARRLVLDGALDAAAERVAAALEAENPSLEARVLASQLSHVLKRGASPELAGGDPVRVQRARERLEFTRRYGVVALGAPAGMLRVVVRFRSRRVGDDLVLLHPLQRAFDLDRSRGVDNTEALQSSGRGGLSARTRFAFSAWRALIAHGRAASDETATISLHDGARRDGHLGLWMEVRQRWGLVGPRLDQRRFLLEHSVPAPLSFRRSFAVSLGRGRVGAFLDEGAAGVTTLIARDKASPGYASVVFPGGELRKLDLIGRWDPDGPSLPAPPSPKQLEAFYEGLRPVSQPERIPLGPGGMRFSHPSTLAELLAARRFPLRARGRWFHTDWSTEILALKRLVGDFELRARIPATGRPGHQFGLAIRSSDRNGDHLLFGIEGPTAGKPELWVATQRGVHYEDLASGRYLEGGEWRLSIARHGDHVLVRYSRAGESAWRPLCPPIHFPLERDVDACLFGRVLVWGRTGEGGGVREVFSDIELRIPKKP